jgi:hypothetical protein
MSGETRKERDIETARKREMVREMKMEINRDGDS